MSQSTAAYGEQCSALDDAATRVAGDIDRSEAGSTPPGGAPVAPRDGARSDIVPIRRSRGFAPLPVRLGEADASVLAVGAELKNTFAIVRDGMAFLSPHLGDMESLASQRAFAASVAQLTRMHRRTPRIVVADKHPGYASSAWAARRADEIGCDLLLVQHHHAHALSLLAEHHLVGRRAVIATLDGTGYGDDGTIWGGEILALAENPLDYERVWHLPGFWMAGGDSAVRRPWKLAKGLLSACQVDEQGLASADAGDPVEARLVASQLDSHVGCVFTTSAGRVFDAVAAMIGVCQRQTYEGQAGTELEALARRCEHQSHSWEPEMTSDDTSLSALVAAIADGYRAGMPTPCLAAGFHRRFADLIGVALLAAAGERRPEMVGLSGGVAQNRLITARLCSAFGPIETHRVVPANDGGLSLGQGLAGYLTVVGGDLCR
jgi:hydrogenase maturation protein HypF